MEISEYTPAQDVTSARARFFQRRVRVLLYTERAHFYFRHRIRGTRVSKSVCGSTQMSQQYMGGP
jgi:U3 small nucleolar RNA-associated protein 25